MTEFEKDILKDYIILSKEKKQKQKKYFTCYYCDKHFKEQQIFYDNNDFLTCKKCYNKNKQKGEF